MSLENGILGYLSMKPMSGYDIKKLFDMSAAFFWPADQAQIYRCIKKLNEDGSIKQQEESSSESANRKIFAITDKGLEVLRAWITTSKQSDFISRLPFLMQIFFSGMLCREEQLALLDAQLEQSNSLLRMLRDNYHQNMETFAETTELTRDDRRLESAVYAHRWGILRSKAYIELLEEIKAEIQKKKG